MFRPVVVVPVYNHGGQVPALVEAVVSFGLPCIVVDDGSDATCAAQLDAVAAGHPQKATLVRHEKNRGKGAAVLTGFERARADGFTHALQIDADGQHAVDDVPAFVALARQHPTSLVAGQPKFDGSIPRSRLYLRYLTHAMVSLNTLNFSLRDAMCGLRVYPLGAVLDLASRVRLGQRMDFDIDVMVRLDWAGVPIVLKTTPVRYPRGGVSHFRLVADNTLITRVHTKLFLGMLWRAPRLLLRRWSAG